MDDLCQNTRARVAAVIKRHTPKRSRRQVNASFSQMEFRVLAGLATRRGLTRSALLRELALVAIGRGRSEEEKELAQLNAGLRETVDVLRRLYRDSDGWQRWQAPELRPVLRRFLALENRARGLLINFERHNAR